MKKLICAVTVLIVSTARAGCRGITKRFLREDAGLTGDHGAYEVCERGIK